MMSSFRLSLAGLIAGTAVVLTGLTPADAQSRRELQNQINDLRAQLTALDNRVGGDLGEESIAVQIMDRFDDMEASLANLNRRVDQLEADDRQMRSELRTFVEELQLRDREMAASLNMPAEFAGFPTLNSLFQEPVRSAGGFGEGGFGGGSTDPFGEPLANGNAAPNGNGVAPSGPRDIFGGGPTDPFDPSAGGLPNAGTGGQVAAGGATPLPNSPDQGIAMARQLIGSGRYDEAEQLLAQFVERFDGHPLQAEAHYLRGETFFVRGQSQGADGSLVYDVGANEMAAEHYFRSIEADPDGARTADAYVRLAAAFFRTDDPEGACATLELLNTLRSEIPPVTLQRADRVRIEAGCL